MVQLYSGGRPEKGLLRKAALFRPVSANLQLYALSGCDLAGPGYPQITVMFGSEINCQSLPLVQATVADSPVFIAKCSTSPEQGLNT